MVGDIEVVIDVRAESQAGYSKECGEAAVKDRMGDHLKECEGLKRVGCKECGANETMLKIKSVSPARFIGRQSLFRVQ
jgi:hypothetical protein